MLRTQDDLLIEYLIDQGGARAEITGRFWEGNATSGQWGAPVDLTTGPLFKYSGTFKTDDDPDTPPLPPQTFSLRDEGTKTYNNVLFDTYTVEELLGNDLPTGGWEFSRVDCAKDAPETGDNPDANVVPNSITGAVVAFTIDNADDVLECTYTNQQRVSTISTAQSVFPNDTATVTGTLGTPPGNVTFELFGPDTTPNNTADNCTGTADFTQTVALNAQGTASTTNGDLTSAPAEFAIDATNEGTYWWKASYAGDTNNPAVTSCAEKTVVDIENGQPVSSG